jgi:radical SAM superfamily enzyme YgiQ (UPF0313 family)
VRISLVFPKWERLPMQTPFVLPPLGVAVVAGLTPKGHEVSIIDENVAPVDFKEKLDLVGVGAMLTCQVPRAFAIADSFREAGVRVVLGGQAVTRLASEAGQHADAVVLGEAEGVWPSVVADAMRGRLKHVYRSQGLPEGPQIAGPARDLLVHPGYSYRGLRMMDLLETSRGCRFDCFFCQTPGLAGRAFRPRDLDAVAAELAGIPGERVFWVDNSPEQDEAHEREMFRLLKSSRKRWVSHSISSKPDIVKLAASSGCWYLYLPVWGVSDVFRQRVRLLRDHGIGVEATAIFGLDGHGPDVFKRMVDFLLELSVELAEFTVLTPFPGTRMFDDMKSSGRLIHEDWGRYNAGRAVFKPAKMTPEKLEAGCRWAWEEFYAEVPQRLRMARLLRGVLPAWSPEPGQ